MNPNDILNKILELDDKYFSMSKEEIISQENVNERFIRERSILIDELYESVRTSKMEFDEIKKIYDILYCNTVKLKDRSQEIKQLLKKKILTTNQLEDREISYDSFFIDKHI